MTVKQSEMEFSKCLCLFKSDNSIQFVTDGGGGGGGIIRPCMSNKKC
jgi:hypothetical protein